MQQSSIVCVSRIESAVRKKKVYLELCLKKKGRKVT